LRRGDLLMVTADHGYDTSAPGADHTREHTPLLIYWQDLKRNVYLGTRASFADIGKTIVDLCGVGTLGLNGVYMACEILPEEMRRP